MVFTESVNAYKSLSIEEQCDVVGRITALRLQLASGPISQEKLMDEFQNPNGKIVIDLFSVLLIEGYERFAAMIK